MKNIILGREERIQETEVRRQNEKDRQAA